MQAVKQPVALAVWPVSAVLTSRLTVGIPPLAGIPASHSPSAPVLGLRPWRLWPPEGSAPSEKPSYRCKSCQPGEPAEFFAFPRRCLAAVVGGQPTVVEIWRDNLDRLQVLVMEPESGWNPAGAAWYIINPDLTIASAESVDGYRNIHDAVHDAGRLNHPYSAHGDSDLFPVLRWIEGRYAPVPTDQR